MALVEAEQEARWWCLTDVIFSGCRGKARLSLPKAGGSSANVLYPSFLRLAALPHSLLFRLLVTEPALCRTPAWSSHSSDLVPSV